MRFLVTGATGLLGSRVAARLLADGHTVRVLCRAGSSRTLLDRYAGQLDWVEGDVADGTSLDEALVGVSHVIHCAAWVGFPGRRGARRMHEVNVVGTANVVDAALAADVQRFAHVSSVAALGRPEIERGGCIDETAVWTESRLNTVYARSKYLAELEVHRAVAEGLDAVIVNPSLIFGPGRSGDNTWRIVESVARGRVPGYPVGSTNAVDADDVADGIMRALDRGQTGGRYILAGSPIPWRDLLTTLATAFDRTPPTRRLSPRFMYAVGAVAEWGARLAGRTPALSRESARISARSTCFDASRARAELGWSARPFSETARRLADAFRSRAAAVAIVMWLAAGCVPSPQPSDRPLVLTTFHALTTLVQPVVGDRAEVVAVLDAGVSPHAFDPRVSDARRAARAMATIYAADGVDSWIIGLGARHAVSWLDLVPDSLTGDGREPVDPHTWLSPLLAASAMPALAAHLCEADPDACDGYQARAASFAADLVALDERIRVRMAPAIESPIVVSSPFLSHFTRHFGPRVTAVVELVEGVEPSPAHLRLAIDASRMAHAVVGQPSLPEGAARAVSEAAGVPFVEVDPIGTASTAPDYAVLLGAIATTLLEATGHE